MREASNGMNLKILDYCLLTFLEKNLKNSTRLPPIVSRAHFMSTVLGLSLIHI